MNFQSNITKFNSLQSIWMMSMLLIFGLIGYTGSSTSTLPTFVVERTIVVKDGAQRILKLEKALSISTKEPSPQQDFSIQYTLKYFEATIKVFLSQYDAHCFPYNSFKPLSPPKILPEENNIFWS